MAHWTLDNIPWQEFNPALADPGMVPIVKAAALVEYNAADYARYLQEVFTGDLEFQQQAKDWADEEIQHGQALRRWAELADPAFDFDAAFRRFTTGYQQVPKGANGSVRGSRCSELIARCIVEMGTSNYYTAIKDRTEEPVLKAIAGKIAADEHRHYKLFYTALQRYQAQEKPSLLRRIRVAVSRVAETEDDELAYAYYAANTTADVPYNRAHYTRLYAAHAYPLYKRRHVDSMAAMLFKAVGLKPHTYFFRGLTTLAWGLVKMRTKMAEKQRVAASPAA